MLERLVFKKETITEKAGSSYFSSSNSFAMIRGGHLDVSILGAMEVSETGDLANWIIPSKMVKGMGGAMDLVSSGSKVIVAMEHLAKGGKPKLLKKCSLPLTGKGVVSLLITDMGVFDFTRNDKLTLIEIFKGVTLDHIKVSTEAEFVVASDLKTLDY